MLHVADLAAGYGDTPVLFGVSFSVGAGEVVTLLGRNGMGKTTTIRAIMGVLPAQRGKIEMDGAPIHRLPPYRIARLGLGLVPEGRQVFPNLTVRENLVATAANRGPQAGPWQLDTVLGLFPALRERLNSPGGFLSGGEQQMLAIARALMGNPSLLLLDEPLEGLAPVVVDRLLAALQHLRSQTQLTMLLTEQHARLALEFSDQAIILDRGRTVYIGSATELLKDPERLFTLIGVAR